VEGLEPVEERLRPGRDSIRVYRGADDEEAASTHGGENGGHVVFVDARAGVVALVAPDAGVDVHVVREDHLHVLSLPLCLVSHPRGEEGAVSARAWATLDDNNCRGTGRDMDRRGLQGGDPFEEPLGVSGKVSFPPGKRPLCDVFCTIGHRGSIFKGIRAEGGEHSLSLPQLD